MTFSSPIPFKEALAFLRSKELLPTSLSSAEISRLFTDVQKRSLFSARTTNADYLQEVKNLTDELLQGKLNEATARAKLQDMLDALSYNPTTHFGLPPEAPGAQGGIPPAELGTLRDLSSDRRIKLILETQERQAANYGYMLQGQSDVARWQFPCWELIRIYPRAHERTGPESWPSRWEQCGGQFYGGGRMIAPKDDPVWSELGSSANFDDALDTSYPPFAFSSGMGRREVPREDCIALGVIPDDYQPAVQDPGFLEGLKVQADKFSPDLLTALLEDLNAIVTDDFLSLQNSAPFHSALANFDPGQPRDSLGCWVDSTGGGLSESDNLHRGAKALTRALRRKQDVRKAMYRKELGQIDFLWGTPGEKAKDYSGGWGVSHIEAKHGRETTAKIPVVIAKGKVMPHPDDAGKTLIQHERHIVSLVKQNDRQAWVLTGHKE